MDILPADAATGPGCLLHSPVLGFSIRVTGVSAPEMTARLQQRGERWPWSRLVERGPVRVELVSTPQPVPEGIAAGQVLEHRVIDGHVRLHSGGPAEVRVGPEHRDEGAILPRSLHLALAQQWARAGILPVHGAVLVTPAGGTLLLGRKGAGKSTLTAAGMVSGMDVVTDDWLLLDLVASPARVERLRDFMMLRHGWASDTIFRQLEGTFPVSSRETSRPRRLMDLPADHPRTPPNSEIHRILDIRRGRSGRATESRIEPLAASEALARLMEASMPLLFSRRLPVEQALLSNRLAGLVGRVTIGTLYPGTDLVEKPASCRSLLDPIPGNATTQHSS